MTTTNSSRRNFIKRMPVDFSNYKFLGRMNQLYQNGYNRKGFLSEQVEKKKGVHVVEEYFKGK
jgi:hypothetical protein